MAVKTVRQQEAEKRLRAQIELKRQLKTTDLKIRKMTKKERKENPPKNLEPT